MKPTINNELEHIRKQHNGLLRAKDVVEYAKNPKTALHKKFEWDNQKAGHEFRLWQAREIIMVHVTIIEGKEETIRTYVSLKQDRVKPGGGYRYINNILSSKRLRKAMLEEAFQELDRMKEKYNLLSELDPIFDAVELVKVKIKKKKIAKAG